LLGRIRDGAVDVIVVGQMLQWSPG
jgi:hypothetical protein